MKIVFLELKHKDLVFKQTIAINSTYTSIYYSVLGHERGILVFIGRKKMTKEKK
jgi:hypothetical protein